MIYYTGITPDYVEWTTGSHHIASWDIVDQWVVDPAPLRIGSIPHVIWIPETAVPGVGKSSILINMTRCFAKENSFGVVVSEAGARDEFGAPVTGRDVKTIITLSMYHHYQTWGDYH